MIRKVLLVASLLWILTGCGRPLLPLAPTLPPTPTLDPTPTDLPNLPIKGTFNGGHVKAGPHVQMTSPRPANPGDQPRAAKIVATGRQALAKYADYHAALDDGYQIIAPDVKQDIYHFGRYADYVKSLHKFDPARPTALLYTKSGSSIKRVGLVYSASGDSSEDQLDALYPLSVARWRAYVNVCVPGNPTNPDLSQMLIDPQYGLAGSIASAADCQAAGGTFMPNAVGWLLYIYFDR